MMNQETTNFVTQEAEKNSEIKNIILNQGKNAWLYLVAKRIDSKEYLSRSMAVPYNPQAPLKTDSPDECLKIKKQLFDNLSYLKDIGEDFNILVDFFKICKTEDYKLKAMECIKKLENYLHSVFYSRSVFINGKFSNVEAGLAWIDQYKSDLEIIGNIIKTYNKKNSKKNNKKINNWVD